MSEPGPRDQRLREIFLASDGEGTREGCPEAALLWQGARGELSGEALGSLVDHLASCGPCTEIWRLAREMAASSHPAAPRRSEAGRMRRRWLGRLTLAAAVLVVAAGVVLLRPGPEPEPASSHREAKEGEIRSLVPESLALPRSACLLRWSDLGEGALYGVSVATVELEPLYSASSLATSELLVPESALADLPAGATILWQVEASLGEDRRILSGTFTQRIE